MSLGSFLKSLVPFVAKDVSKIDADAKAALVKLQADTASKVKSINLEANVDKIKAQLSADVVAANTAWSQHIALLQADAAAKVKAATPTSILVQLGVTGTTSGPTGPTA